jgi:hypothetical protein
MFGAMVATRFTADDVLVMKRFGGEVFRRTA